MNLNKTLAFSMKKYVYLIVIQQKKCIIANSHAFRLLDGVGITPSYCKIIFNNFARIKHIFTVYYINLLHIIFIYGIQYFTKMYDIFEILLYTIFNLS